MEAASGAASDDVFPPRPIDPALLEEGRRLFAAPCRFVAAAPSSGSLPAETLPEIAFAGRSNVGKSSLLNALAGTRALAPISKSPGRTRQIRFYDLGGRLMLVDLPGYGYAEAPRSLRERWTLAFRRYLESRGTLMRTCLLIDSRHGIKEPDRPVMELLDALAISYQIILTKTDKLAADEGERVVAAVAAETKATRAAHPEIHLTSARTGRGIAALRAALDVLASPAREEGDRPTSAVAARRSAR